MYLKSIKECQTVQPHFMPCNWGLPDTIVTEVIDKTHISLNYLPLKEQLHVL